jgi:hypothetical protein
MSRTVFPFAAGDVSALARSLSRELEACESKPGHVQMLNMLARAVGYRNFQHFRAQQAAQDRLDVAPAPAAPVDHLKIERVAGHFNDAGVMIRWPAKTSQQRLCLWALWSRLPAGVVLNERQVNDLLKAAHSFGDHALLRRELFGAGLVTRTADCREYRKVGQRPPPEALALLRRLAVRAGEA